MRKPSVAHIVYNATFPRPRNNDPGSFAAHITRNLVPEVRVETSLFYGPLDSIEAKYPGLDYSYGPHRIRLSRFPWHRKLFATFNELGLTESEISDLCRWEGTKSARQRYEAEEKVKVQDTTAQSVRLASPPPPPSIEMCFDDFCGPEERNIEIRSNETIRASVSRASNYQAAMAEPGTEGDPSDDEMESCGVALNNRIHAAMAARDRGTDVPLDEDWEQWLKDAGERGRFGEMVHAIRLNQPLDFLYENALTPQPRNLVPSAASLPDAYMISVPDSILPNSAIPYASNTSGTA